MGWFLYDRDLRHERFNEKNSATIVEKYSFTKTLEHLKNTYKII